MIRLSRKQFQAWLDAKEPDVVVGLTWWPGQCPLANYLTEKLDSEWSRVTCDALYYYVLDRTTRLAPWAKEFVRRVDNLHNRITGKPVLACKAASILRSIPS